MYSQTNGPAATFKVSLFLSLSPSHSVKRRSFKGHRRSQGGHMPTLPRRPDALVKEEQLISRKVRTFILNRIPMENTLRACV